MYSGTGRSANLGSAFINMNSVYAFVGADTLNHAQETYLGLKGLSDEYSLMLPPWKDSFSKSEEIKAFKTKVVDLLRPEISKHALEDISRADQKFVETHLDDFLLVPTYYKNRILNKEAANGLIQGARKFYPEKFSDIKLPKVVDTGSVRFKAGLILLASSYIFGWPMLGVLEAVAAYTKSSTIAVIVAPSFYVLSWIMLGASIWLAGPEAKTYFVERYRAWKAKRKSID